jgi:hypothetical protein
MVPRDSTYTVKNTFLAANPDGSNTGDGRAKTLLRNAGPGGQVQAVLRKIALVPNTIRSYGSASCSKT